MLRKNKLFTFFQHRNLWTEIFTIYLQCPSLYHHLKTLFNAEILWGGRTSGNQVVRANVGCKEDVVADWWFLLFLLQPWSLELSGWNPTKADFRKSKIIRHNFVSCTHRNSPLFRNVLYCHSSVCQNERINWICHFKSARLPGLTSSWILFRPSLNYLSLICHHFE